MAIGFAIGYRLYAIGYLLFPPVFFFLGGKVEGDRIDARYFQFGAAVGACHNFPLHRLAGETDTARTFGAFGGGLGRANGLSEHG